MIDKRMPGNSLNETSEQNRTKQKSSNYEKPSTTIQLYGKRNAIHFESLISELKRNEGSFPSLLSTPSTTRSGWTDEKLLLLDRDGIIGRPCLFMAFIFLEIAGEDEHRLSCTRPIFLRQHVDPRFMIRQLRGTKDCPVIGVQNLFKLP